MLRCNRLVHPLLVIVLALAVERRVPAQCNPSLTPCGDCNRGGRVEITDALFQAQVAAQIATPDACQRLACDVNATGDITVLDALLVALIITHNSRSSGALPAVRDRHR